MDTVGDVVSSFVYLDLWDQPSAHVRPFNLPERFFDKVNSAKGFSLLTGGERRCVKWFKNVFTVKLTELLQ